MQSSPGDYRFLRAYVALLCCGSLWHRWQTQARKAGTPMNIRKQKFLGPRGGWWLVADGGRLRSQAALAKGMQSLSQADVGSTLQAFFNLEELTQVRHLACR